MTILGGAPPSLDNNPTSEQTSSAPAEREGWDFATPAAVVLGFAIVALEGVIFAGLRAGSADGQYGPRAAHFLFAFAELTGAGVLAAAMTFGWQQAPARLRARVPTFAPIAIVALAIGALVLPEDLGGIVLRLAARVASFASPLLVGAIALACAAATAVALRARRRVGRAPLIGAGVALGGVQAFLPADYPGLHLMVALVAASWVAIALGEPTPARATAWLNAPGRRKLVAGVEIALGLAFAGALFVPVPSAVLADMLLSPATVLAPFVRSAGLGKIGTAHVPPRLRQWFTYRAERASAPTHAGGALPANGVVVLLTVDALRADVVMSGKHDDELPTFKELRKKGVRFTNARTPAPQTVIAITSLFSGKYYSSLCYGGGSEDRSFANEDHSVRFSDVLTQAGVKTVTFPTLPYLTPDGGTVGGFAEVGPRKVRPHEISTIAADLGALIVARLEAAAADPKPTFIYAHFTDPHDPYDRGGTDCEQFDCYVREVALVDKALGRIRATMEEKLAGRAVLIVAADHGEAFKEHGTTHHATTMFDEVLRIPLLVTGPGFEPRKVTTPVTLLDVGPTILDLFGQKTPPEFMGESLLGALKGEKPAFSRPIAADSGRLMQAMVFEDGIKIMRDKRKQVVQLFDLKKDPGERTSLFERAPDAADRLALLDAFFAANACRQKNYAPPYRR